MGWDALGEVVYVGRWTLTLGAGENLRKGGGTKCATAFASHCGINKLNKFNKIMGYGEYS